MDAHHYARIMAGVAAEADRLRRTRELLLQHSVGPGWRGPSRRRAEEALADTRDSITTAIMACDRAWSEARAAYREALRQSAVMG